MEMSTLREALPARDDRTEERRPRRNRSLSADMSSHTALSTQNFLSTPAREDCTSGRHSTDGRMSTADFISREDSQRSLDARAQAFMLERSSTLDFISQADSQLSSADIHAWAYRTAFRATSKREPSPWESLFLQLPPLPFHPVYSARNASTHSAGSSTVRFTPGTEWHEPGCTVASIATVAKVSYETARAKAADIAGFDGSSGVGFRDAEDVLKSLGVHATTHHQGDKWSALPNLAIITVEGGNNVPHAVVFKRKDGEEFIYDYGRVGRPSDYQLYRGSAEYIEIHRSAPN